ncbi:aminoacyl-tRNA hydrolase [Chloroflexota bacterium]
MMVVLGLGNPGRAYARSRHNVGFWCVNSLAREHAIRLEQRRRHAVLGKGSIMGEEVVLAKPRTYMNRSGVAARYLLDRYRLAPAALLVVHDDMDLPVGKLRIRTQGSSAGHNGIESIITELGTQQFPRLRIGIGHLEGQDAIPFVLGPFTMEEAKVIGEAVDRAVEAVAWVAQHGLEAAMNRYN